LKFKFIMYAESLVPKVMRHEFEMGIWPGIRKPTVPESLDSLSGKPEDRRMPPQPTKPQYVLISEDGVHVRRIAG